MNVLFTPEWDVGLKTSASLKWISDVYDQDLVMPSLDEPFIKNVKAEVAEDVEMIPEGKREREAEAFDYPAEMTREQISETERQTMKRVLQDTSLESYKAGTLTNIYLPGWIRNDTRENLKLFVKYIESKRTAWNSDYGSIKYFMSIPSTNKTTTDQAVRADSKQFGAAQKEQWEKVMKHIYEQKQDFIKWINIQKELSKQQKKHGSRK